MSDVHAYPDLVQGLSRLIDNTRKVHAYASLREKAIVEVANLLCDLVDLDRRMDLRALDLPGRLRAIGAMVEAASLNGQEPQGLGQYPQDYPTPQPYRLQEALARADQEYPNPQPQYAPVQPPLPVPPPPRGSIPPRANPPAPMPPYGQRR